MIQQLHFHKPDGLSLSLVITAITPPILISPLNFHIQIQQFSLFCCITFLQTACFNSTASLDSLHWLQSTTCIPFVLQSSLFITRNWRPPPCVIPHPMQRRVFGDERLSRIAGGIPDGFLQLGRDNQKPVGGWQRGKLRERQRRGGDTV